MVSPEPVVPLREIRVPDAAEYLLRRELEEKLLIVRYPRRIAGIPEDDEDLVYRAVIWTKRFGRGVLEELAKYHPHLLPQVRRALAEGRYSDER